MSLWLVESSQRVTEGEINAFVVVAISRIGVVGIEPTTRRLEGVASTTEIYS